MSKTETKTSPDLGASRAGPTLEVKTALAGFLSDFSNFQADIKERLTKQEERMTMIDRKNMMSRRPVLSQAAEVEAPHKKAFAAYLRSGDDDGLRGLAMEEKALSTAVAADGGYLVDPQTADRVAGVLRNASSIRAVANVVQVEATAYDVLIDHSDIGAGWASETAAAGETGTPQVERITIPLHELSALPKASQRLLDDSAFSVEDWLAAARQALTGTTDNATRVEAMVRAYFRFVEEPGGAFRLVFESDLAHEPAVRERVDAADLTLTTLSASVIAEDTGLSHDQAMLLASGMHGLVQVSARNWMRSGEDRPPREQAAELVASLAWRGISSFPLSHPPQAE